MRRIYIALLFFLLVAPAVAPAQQPGLETISAEDMRKHLTIIASDSLAGRGVSTQIPGLEYAADYLEKQVEKIGLKPATDGYTQNFSIIKSKPKKADELTVINKHRQNDFQTDSLIGLTRGIPKQNIKAQPVFAGFGWQDEKTGYNDWNKIDVKGKIAVLSVGKPGAGNANEPAGWNTELEAQKVERAIEKEAAAVIFVSDVNDSVNHTYNQINHLFSRPTYVLGSGLAFEKIPVVLVTPHVASSILGKDFRKLITSISEKKEPNSFALHKVYVRLKIDKKTESIPVKNIVGIVEGNDPALKKECVVYMAHYDHLGTDKNGNVYNGADDNGTGTAALLEIAEAFSALKQKPARSIVFLWVTAEEIGLLGSEYYTQHPVVPLSKTLACINLDMVGRVYEPRDSVWDNSPKLVKNFDGIYTLTSDFYPELESVTDSVAAELGLVPDKSLPDYFYRTSDHHYFHSNGVPILNLATGYHADYHKISDEISKINFEKMKRVANMAFLIGYEMANRKSTTKEKAK